MKTETFISYIRLFDESCNKLLDSKGKDYTLNSQDRLRNFKSFEEFGVSKKQAWLVYAKKHFDAICSFIAGNEESEPIEQRLYDLANYVKLLYCLIKEEGEKDNSISPSIKHLEANLKALGYDVQSYPEAA